ncbi:hypothetical protein MNV49_000020 [Pseudohyphozyma bogoriensis]|nr:hypothetical protein MNV49_000020 [Pseudohyphozyma bogoriensis]
MKIILSGATGRIGGACLERMLALPAVSQVVVLSRRALSLDSPKLKVIILTDEEFLSYPEHVLEQLEGASGFIWALGSNSFPTPELMRKITYDYPVAAAKACAALPPLAGKLRFIYSSGMFVPEDPTAKLWFLEEHRQTGSKTCIEVRKLANEHLETIIVKPGGVLEAEAGWAKACTAKLFSFMCIEARILGAAEVDIVLNGSDGVVVQNAELKERGLKALE